MQSKTSLGVSTVAGVLRPKCVVSVSSPRRFGLQSRCLVMAISQQQEEYISPSSRSGCNELQALERMSVVRGRWNGVVAFGRIVP